jgi:hypothetical protein
VYIHDRLSEQFFRSQADFGTFFRVTGSYPKDGTSSLKRVTGRIFKLVSDFLEVGRNFLLDFFTKRQLKIVKTISAHSGEIYKRRHFSASPLQSLPSPFSTASSFQTSEILT